MNISRKNTLFAVFGIVIGLLIGSISTFMFVSNEHNNIFARYLWTVGAYKSQRILELLNYLEQGEIEKAKWKGEDLLVGETSALEGCLDDMCNESGSKFMIESIIGIVDENNSWIAEKGMFSSPEEKERYLKYSKSQMNRDFGIYTENDLREIRKILNKRYKDSIE